ncbi:hypothetical protein [Verrucosispora sp. NA02020]|uniref:hypothetical protein n=1 Tax=Verrucosispora sp. NA02020 TaxID=2742132 RepID=UPI001592472C|nr:hypothetical protein [Verrucosispora sp. NA02020]QKW17601.1 hypothetical protein HUT12_32360 [Verrucosispora sp. NA02020]
MTGTGRVDDGDVDQDAGEADLGRVDGAQRGKDVVELRGQAAQVPRQQVGARVLVGDAVRQHRARSGPLGEQRLDSPR